jgi:hypothetical protein
MDESLTFVYRFCNKHFIPVSFYPIRTPVKMKTGDFKTKTIFTLLLATSFTTLYDEFAYQSCRDELDQYIRNNRW